MSTDNKKKIYIPLFYFITSNENYVYLNIMIYRGKKGKKSAIGTIIVYLLVQKKKIIS